jgi:hypothetical protein
MGRRSRVHKIEAAHLAVTFLGVVGFLALLAAARASDNSSFEIAAIVWFAVFGVIKVSLCHP